MTFEWPIRVYIEDTDAGGIVYYAKYLHFLERARTEWLRTLGFSQETLRKTDILFVVREVKTKYLAPARLDDELIVTVVIEQSRRVGLTMKQQVLRQQGSQAVLLVDGYIELACINHAGKPCAMPVDFIQALSAITEAK